MFSIGWSTFHIVTIVRIHHSFSLSIRHETHYYVSLRNYATVDIVLAYYLAHIFLYAVSDVYLHCYLCRRLHIQASLCHIAIVCAPFESSMEMCVANNGAIVFPGCVACYVTKPTWIELKRTYGLI